MVLVKVHSAGRRINILCFKYPTYGTMFVVLCLPTRLLQTNIDDAADASKVSTHVYSYAMHVP